MDAALLATVLVGGLRNARRRGVELAEQARLTSEALAEQADDGQLSPACLCGSTWPGRRRASSTPATPVRSGCGPRRWSSFGGGRPPVRRPAGTRLPGASAADGGGRPAD